LSVTRLWICDLLHFAQQVPSIPVQREVNVAALRDELARGRAPVGWFVLFTKAYGIVTQRFPELRRAYLSLPWPHLYEHPYSIASVAIEREYRGEKAIFFAHLRGPETQPLTFLQSYLRRLKEEPVERFGLFRRALFIGRFPRPLRRLLWWYGLNSSGHKRARRMGTFGVSVYSGLGAESLHPLSPLTSTLNYGVIQPDGRVTVRIIYDHRVLDGATVARALACLDQVLQQEILDELKAIGAAAAA
jgi:hypothetical protein